MPVAESQNPTPAAGVRSDSHAAQMERLEQRAQLAENRVVRDREQERVAARLGPLLHAARAYRDHRTEELRHQRRLSQVREQHADLQGGVHRSIGAIIVAPVKWMAVLAIDGLLLFAVAHYLVSLAWSRPGGPPTWATLLVPAAVFGIEIALAVQIATARRNANLQEA